MSSGAMVPAADPRHRALVDQMLAEVERARQLEGGQPVPAAFLDRKGLIAHVRAHVSRELPPEAIRDEGLSLQLLGFIPSDFDYEAAEYRMLEQQLAGYYEPADGTMYMATDLDDDEATATLAHELVHALQDRHWNLEERARYKPGEGDRAEATSALAEGDATSAMFDVMISRVAGSARTALDIPAETFIAQIQQGVAQGASAEPHIMATSLAAPYIYGTLFVNALRRQGGWKAVDAAWETPPVTTEQVLHLDKWLAHEPPLPIEPPPFATLGSGWRVLEEDSEGELGTRIAFEEWLGPARAAETSAGWGGDRGVLVSDGQRSAFAWSLRYDAGAQNVDRARRAYEAIEQALELHGRREDGLKEPGFVCRERSDRGPIAVGRRGQELVFVTGPARTATSPWSSAGTCARSRAWVKEIQEAP